MENVKAIVTQVMKIWRLYKTQQLTLKAAMRLEIPFGLRKLLSRDFMICSLLKKEMANLYDALKCCMLDTCITRPETKMANVIREDGNLITTLATIERLHQQIYTEYEILLELVKNSNLNLRIIHQHQKEMNKMASELSEQILMSDDLAYDHS